MCVALARVDCVNVYNVASTLASCARYCDMSQMHDASIAQATNTRTNLTVPSGDAENSLGSQPEEQGDTEAGNNRNIDPATLAENCLRELVGRASFGNIRSVIKPVFK